MSDFNLDSAETRAALNLTDIRHLSVDWWDARSKAITGTDAAAILGCSRWATPLDAWYRLFVQQPEKKKETAFMRWGQLCEGINGREFENATGSTVHMNDRLAMHPTLPIVGSPDAFIEDPFLDGIGVLELKAPSAYTADEWAEGEAPEHYRAQTLLYMLACNLEWGVLSAIVPPSRADDDIIRTSRVTWLPGEKLKMSVKLADWFKTHITEGRQPDAIAGDQARLKQLHANDELRTVMLDIDTSADLASLKPAQQAEKDAKKNVADIKARLMQQMGNAIYATTPDPDLSLSWKTNAKGVRTMRQMKHLPTGAPDPS